MPHAPSCEVLFHQRFYVLKPLMKKGVAGSKLWHCKGLGGHGTTLGGVPLPK